MLGQTLGQYKPEAELGVAGTVSEFLLQKPVRADSCSP
jgi:hypothetical protein